MIVHSVPYFRKLNINGMVTPPMYGRCLVLARVGRDKPLPYLM